MNVQLIPGAVRGNSGGAGGRKGNSRDGQDQSDQRARELISLKHSSPKRLKPMMIDGKKVYQIGLPIHQGFRGIDEDEG